uniref:Uncharacterized protein n=1 Tax=Anguilla anguilla TaxID=7936 RepID=A0A0E9QRF9_ANGAN
MMEILTLCSINNMCFNYERTVHSKLISTKIRRHFLYRITLIA